MSFCLVYALITQGENQEYKSTAWCLAKLMSEITTRLVKLCFTSALYDYTAKKGRINSF